MKERILAYCEAVGITANAFEQKAGWSPSTIYNLNKGVRSDKLADAAIAFPDLNIRWLLTGEGPMIYEISYTKQSPSPSVSIGTIQTVNIGNWSELVDLLKQK